MKILGRKIVSDGTHIYMARGNGLYKVAGDGTNTTLSTDMEYVALTYGNSVLYGANKHGIYSIHVTTGVATFIVARRDVESIAYYDTDTLAVLAGNGLMSMVITQDSATADATLGTIGAGTAVLGATATGTVVLVGEAVTDITITDAGFYETAPTISIADAGGGTGATATCTIDANGTVDAITITAPGASYSSVPVATFTDSEAVASVTVDTAGVYLVAPTIGFTGGAGSGAAGTAIIDANGTVTGITMTDSGSGYTSVPTVTFTDPAAFIVSCTITDAGQGYQSAPAITLSGGGGSGATAVCTINASGNVTGITMLTAGTGYSTQIATIAAAPAAGAMNYLWQEA